MAGGWVVAALAEVAMVEVGRVVAVWVVVGKVVAETVALADGEAAPDDRADRGGDEATARVGVMGVV